MGRQRKLWLLPVLLVGLLLGTSLPAQEPISADDILPPVLGGKTQIAKLDKVKIKPGKIEAASAQDACNAAVGATVKELAADPTATGTVLIQFPSGLGYVSTGIGTYGSFDNRTATLISKRKAYLMAFLHAKKNLAETLDGLTSESKETLHQELLKVNLPKEDAIKLKTVGEESLKQTVQMMLRGFVVYEVRDDPKTRAIYVSIATSPKTRRQVVHLTSHAMNAEDLRQGINQVLAELKAGVVPPVGGRILQIRDKRETVLVGFGSAIVGRRDDPTLQAKLTLEAGKIAQMRAHDSLLGLLKGDALCWHGEVVDKHKHEITEFAVQNQKDPTAADPADLKKLDQARETFVSVVKSTEEYRSARAGKLPPGLIQRHWLDKNRDWAFAITIYWPSLAKNAGKAAQETRDGLLVPGPDGPKIGSVPPGPSGKVSKDKDM